MEEMKKKSGANPPISNVTALRDLVARIADIGRVSFWFFRYVRDAVRISSQ